MNEGAESQRGREPLKVTQLPPGAKSGGAETLEMSGCLHAPPSRASLPRNGAPEPLYGPEWGSRPL